MPVCWSRVSLGYVLAVTVGYCGTVLGAEIVPIELKALEARRAIQRGHIQLEWTYWRIFDSGEKKTWFDRRVIYFDGSKIRNDKFVEYDAARAKSHGKLYREVGCWTEDEYVSYSDQVLENGHTIALTIRPREERTPGHRPIDARLIGMVPESTANLAGRSLETVLGRPGRRKTSTEQVVFNGDKSTLVEYERKDGVVARVWICPEKQHSVVKCQIEDAATEPRYLDTVGCSLVRHEQSGVWFPESYVYTRLKDAKLVAEERATVTIFSLNAPLEDDTFTLAGIGVPAGKVVRRIPRPPDGLQEYWDGEKIAAFGPGSDPTPPTRSTTRRILLGAVCVLAAIAAVILLVHGRRRRSGADRSNVHGGHA